MLVDKTMEGCSSACVTAVFKVSELPSGKLDISPGQIMEKLI